MSKINQFRFLSISLLIFCLLMIFLTYKSLAQAEIGFHVDYSTKYKVGGGIEGGTWLNNSYIGGDILAYGSRGRKSPVSIDAKYGYDINRFIPFLIAGYYTSGGESNRDHEGIQGLEYGAGLSYHFKDSPIKISIEQTNIKTNFSFSLIHFL